MITISKYIETEGQFYLVYSFIGFYGEYNEVEKTAKSKVEMLRHINTVCRDFILIQLEISGIDTKALHNMDVTSLVSRIDWMRNTISRKVIRSKDVFRAKARLMEVINKLND